MVHYNSRNEVSDIKNIKQKILPASLCGAAVGFTWFFFGAVDTFAGNRGEFLFSFSDFGWQLALIALAASLVIALALLFTDNIVHRVLFGIFFWIALMGYVQAIFLNVGMGSLAGDDVGTKVKPGFVIFDTALWIVMAVLCVIGAIKMKKFDIIKTVAVILLIMIVGMQFVGCVSNIPKVTDSSVTKTESPQGTDAPSDGTETTGAPATTEKPDKPDENVKQYLTEAGINEVSAGKNIVVFVIDRFDISYYQEMKSKDPKFFEKLKGFTYFNDNISLYSRTYPGVATMITGVDYEYTDTPKAWGASPEPWFEKAYGTSPFLSDLQKNGYRIKLYTADYYGYRDARAMNGRVYNVSGVSKYEVTDRGALVGSMLQLALYRCLPTALKSSVSVSTSSFSGVISYGGEAPAYKVDDPRAYELLSGGLTVDDSEKSYTLIHLNGCHQPYNMDENGNRVENGSFESAMRGCFGMIYSYIDEMRRLGVYEDSTIIITGDHPSARDDGEIPAQPRLTALFVKPAGTCDEPLAYSHAQVSQENLIPTIVKSAGIETENDYGRSYFDIAEGENVTRHHKFELYDDGDTRIIDFAVTGMGRDFSNWKIVSDINIGSLYN